MSEEKDTLPTVGPNEAGPSHHHRHRVRRRRRQHRTRRVVLIVLGALGVTLVLFLTVLLVIKLRSAPSAVPQVSDDGTVNIK